MTLTIGMWGNCYIISIIKDLLVHNFFLLSLYFGVNEDFEGKRNGKRASFTALNYSPEYTLERKRSQSTIKRV